MAQSSRILWPDFHSPCRLAIPNIQQLIEVSSLQRIGKGGVPSQILGENRYLF